MTEPSPAAGPTNFAELADALFVAIQFEAEREALLRIVVNRAGPNPAKLLTELEDAEARGKQLLELFTLLYALVPFERQARAALGRILEGDHWPAPKWYRP